MLRKLMKHELRATGRIMLPLFGVLLVTAVGANVSIRGLTDSDVFFLNLLGGLFLIAFVVAMAAVCLIAFALMVRRFHKNLLEDEGYVMMTLPVSVHQHIWSKLIVSTVWFAATIVVVILACFVVAFNVELAQTVLAGFRVLMQEIARNFSTYYAVNGTIVVLEGVVICVLASFVMCLQCYSAMAIGYSFPNRKGLMSVGVFFGMELVLSLVEGLVISLVNDSALHYAMLGWTDGISATAGLHLSMWFLIGLEAVYGAGYYAFTTYFLKKHLNLE